MKFTWPTILFVMTAVLITACSGVPAVDYPQAPETPPMYDLDAVGNESKWTINNMHDPSIIKDGDTYYVFSTDNNVAKRPIPGIMVRKSTDLIHWEWVGYALDGVPKEAKEWTKAMFLWAPDIVKRDETYYLYYSASIFGTNKSFIGVATSSSIEGPWTDQGEVLKTDKGDEPNAIDPSIITDEAGDLWMTYGSFFGGIYIIELDPATGKPKEEGYGMKIATRDDTTEEGAVEGPYIIYHPKYKQYYLFVSYDSLFEDYNVRVGRADHVTGPYLDSRGQSLTDVTFQPQYEVGEKIVSGYRFNEGEGWLASGHNSVLQDGDETFMVHHARGETNSNWSYLHVRRMLWTEDGWPLVSPERYAGEKLQVIDQDLIPGQWERIVLSPDIDGQSIAEPIELLASGKINDENSNDYWEYIADNQIAMYWHDQEGQLKVEEKAVVLASWDWELERPTLVLTGRNTTGIAIWGKKLNHIADP